MSAATKPWLNWWKWWANSVDEAVNERTADFIQKTSQLSYRLGQLQVRHALKCDRLFEVRKENFELKQRIKDLEARLNEAHRD